jgi:hypothetical protein
MLTRAKPLTDVTDIDALALEGKGRIACDHEKLAEVQEGGSDLLHDSVGEPIHAWVVGHALERQDSHRWPALVDRDVGRVIRRVSRGLGLNFDVQAIAALDDRAQDSPSGSPIARRIMGPGLRANSSSRSSDLGRSATSAPLLSRSVRGPARRPRTGASPSRCPPASAYSYRKALVCSQLCEGRLAGNGEGLARASCKFGTTSTKLQQNLRALSAT